MKPASFAYHRASSLEDALAALRVPGTKPLAGGQSLIPAMNFRLAQPARLVDLNGIASLSGIEETPNGGLRIGSMARQRALETNSLVAARAPLLAEAMPHIAHLQIRNRGTVGGSLAHADPAAELPAVVVALGATLEISRANGSRRVAAADFFTGLFATALDSEELLTAIVIPPLPARSGWAFEEMSRRQGDYALVGVAATVTLDGQQRCATAQVVLLSVGEGPVPVPSVVAALQGREANPGNLVAAAAAVQHDIDPPADIHASAVYRRQLAQVLTGRALERAFARAMAR